MSDEPGFLSETDTRAVVRLLGEVARRAGDLNGKRHALMSGLAAMTGTDKWIWATASINNAERMPVVLAAVQEGFTPDELAAQPEEVHTAEMPPEYPPVIALIESGQRWTRRRQDLVSDQQWYEPANVARHKRMGYEHFLWSHFPAGEPGNYSIMGLFRDWGRPAFTEREARIAHLVCSEVDWLHFDQPPSQQVGLVGTLSPRLRTVLTLLLNGFDRNSIADELALSRHTVADYMKQIYRHFDVRSQQQLIRHFNLKQ